MNQAGAAALVAGASLLWSALLFYAVFWRKNSLVVSQKSHPPPPVAVALFSGVWSLAVIVWVLIWRTYSSKTGELSIGTTNWFSFGWQTGLLFFGIPIDRWYTYLLIVWYQITRSVIGSLLSTVFSPYLVAVQNKSNPVRPQHRRLIKLAQLCKGGFGWVAAITDLFLYLSQVDIALISLAVGSAFDWESTEQIMAAAAETQASTVNLRTVNTRPLGLQYENSEVLLD